MTPQWSTLRSYIQGMGSFCNIFFLNVGCFSNLFCIKKNWWRWCDITATIKLKNYVLCLASSSSLLLQQGSWHVSRVLTTRNKRQLLNQSERRRLFWQPSQNEFCQQPEWHWKQILTWNFLMRTQLWPENWLQETPELLVLAKCTQIPDTQKLWDKNCVV